ncbi:hypothetical protein [Aureibacillus halotolerans]|uniref:Uncharacterized protein n=1 Tax=Aureibacillus halotolerans TaxID=1508390 RepID=A0A4R6TMB6_9BACI|nr:hypothetical protein [Aureibacillus halotolerans]TDQ32170.1 hypothetical protein EV213_13216 [Aureibacillus halotolerans]
MNIIANVVFWISMIALALFTFDINVGVTNRTLLIVIYVGFLLSILFAVFLRGQTYYKWILGVSAFILLLFGGYNLWIRVL